MIQIHGVFDNYSIAHRLVSEEFIQCFENLFNLEPFSADPEFLTETIREFIYSQDCFEVPEDLQDWKVKEISKELKGIYKALLDSTGLFTFDAFGEFLLDTVVRAMSDVDVANYNIWLQPGTWAMRQEMYKDALKATKNVLENMGINEDSENLSGSEIFADAITMCLLSLTELKRGTEASKLIYVTPESEMIKSWNLKGTNQIPIVKATVVDIDMGVSPD